MQVQGHRLNYAAAIAAALLCGASAVQAQGALVTDGVVVATNGDVINGAAGEVFIATSAFDNPVIDESGNVLFRGKMSGGGVTPAPNLNDRALFRGTTKANLTMVVRTNDACPGLPGILLNTAAGSGTISGSPRLSPDGRAMFSSSLRDPVTALATTVDSAILGGFTGSYAVLVREGDAAPGTAGATFGTSFSISQQSTGINGSGRILFQSATLGGDTVTANNAGWWAGLPGSLELVQRKNDTVLGGAVVSALGFVSQMNASGQVVHSETLSTTLGSTPASASNDKVLFIFTPGSGNATIVREGDTAPGTASAIFGNATNTWAADIGASAFNSSGQIAAWYELTGGDTVGTTNNGGLFRLSSSGGTLIIRKGDPAPGTDGVWNFASTASVCMNNSGQIAVQGSITGGTSTAANDSGIWFWDGASLQLIAREGDTHAEVGGDAFDQMTGISPFHLNDLGQILFQANLLGADPATRSLWSWDPVLGLRMQISDTDLIEVAPTVFKTSFTWGGIQFNNGDAQALSLNKSGKFALQITHTVGSSIIIGNIPHATPSTVLCSGDGTDAPCPCTNPGLAGRGCDNTFATGGASISTSGVASISADTLVLTGSDAVPFGPGLYYEGSTTANPSAPFGVVFGNGLRCAGGTTNRLEIQFADGFGASSTTVPLGAFGAAVAGSTYYYQLWYRDTGNVGTCTPGAGFNFSNARSLTWGL